MKKLLTLSILCVASCISAALMKTQKPTDDFKISLCGKTGKFKKKTIDSLLNAQCKKLVLEPNEPGAMIVEYACTLKPKDHSQKETKQEDLPGGMFFPFINRFL